MATRNHLLTAFLVRHRELRSPQDLGRPSQMSPRRGRPWSRISMELMAKEIGVSKPYYRQIEHGTREPKASELDQIAAVLQMTWRGRAALFRRALGCEPTAASGSGTVSAPAGLRHCLLARQPSCVTDHAYNVLSFNEDFTKVYPAVAGGPAGQHNLLRALLLDPQAREQAATSPEWIQELTAELAEAAAFYPADATLQELHQAVAADHLIGPLYEEAPSYTYPDRDCKYVLSHALPGPGLRQLTLVCETPSTPL